MVCRQQRAPAVRPAANAPLVRPARSLADEPRECATPVLQWRGIEHFPSRACVFVKREFTSRPALLRSIPAGSCPPEQRGDQVTASRSTHRKSRERSLPSSDPSASSSSHPISASPSTAPSPPSTPGPLQKSRPLELRGGSISCQVGRFPNALRPGFGLVGRDVCTAPRALLYTSRRAPHEIVRSTAVSPGGFPATGRLGPRQQRRNRLGLPRPLRYSQQRLALSGPECQNLLNRAPTGGRIS